MQLLKMMLWMSKLKFWKVAYNLAYKKDDIFIVFFYILRTKLGLEPSRAFPSRTLVALLLILQLPLFIN